MGKTYWSVSYRKLYIRERTLAGIEAPRAASRVPTAICWSKRTIPKLISSSYLRKVNGQTTRIQTKRLKKRWQVLMGKSSLNESVRKWPLMWDKSTEIELINCKRTWRNKSHPSSTVDKQAVSTSMRQQILWRLHKTSQHFSQPILKQQMRIRMNNTSQLSSH